MRPRVVWAMAMLWLATVAGVCAASVERVEEVWRSPGGRRGDLQVNEGDGSLWLVEGANVAHWSCDGELLNRSPALCQPQWLAPNPADGSCWVSQGPGAGLAHLGADARVLSVTPGFDRVAGLTLSPCDGSVWVTHYAYGPLHGWIFSRVSASGQELVRWQLLYSESGSAAGLIVDPADGSIWVLTSEGVTRARADGTRLWQAPGFDPVGDADPSDQSLWVAVADGAVAHLSANGELLWQSGDLIGGGFNASRIHVSHTDRSVWISFSRWYQDVSVARSAAWVLSDQSVHLDASGAALPAPVGYLRFFSDLDGSAWAQVWGSGAMTHYSSDGQVIGVFTGSLPRAYDQTRNAFWSVDDLELRYLGPDGAVLWQQERPSGLRLAGRSVNPQDGSVWAVDRDGLVRLSPTGEVLARRGAPVENMHSLTVSPYDGTWWVSDGFSLTHLSADGAVLSQYLPYDGWLSEPVIDPADGSLWWVCNDTTTETGPRAFVRHLGRDGILLWTVAYPVNMAGPTLAPDGSAWVASLYPDEGTRTIAHLSATGEPLGTPVALPAELIGRSVNEIEFLPTDGSFLMSGAGRPPSVDACSGWLCRVAGDGSLLWEREGLCFPSSIAVNPADGSFWVAYWREEYYCELGPPSAVMHYAPDGTELWRGRAFDAPADLALDPRDGSVWVSASGDEQIVHLQLMALFPDVSADSWAYDAIAACAEAGIVAGFPGGNYRPEIEVTRDQMAVYIARALALPTGDAAVQVPSGVAEPTFPDVDAEHWAYRYVEYCVGASIVEGFPDGGYHPGEAVNRGQMAVYVARALVTPSGDAALPDPPDEPTFPDVTADNDWSWCYQHVEYCAAEGIVQGYWDGYHPERLVTRDQMAVYIARAFALPM
jgi:sugar lactone lactonase YvrE